VSEKDPERCRYVVDRGKKVFIPACWGGVNHGPSGCYCDRLSNRGDVVNLYQVILEKMNEIQGLIEQLEERMMS
jgi:hypothetical protein